MSDKLNAALTTLDEARANAMKAALADKLYRACAVLDEAGPLQRSINRARKLIAPKAKKASK